MLINTEIEDGRIDVNLDNPIFVHYINVGSYPRDRADEMIHQVQRCTSVYRNITFWIVPIQSGETRIECVYDGSTKNLDILLKSVSERLEFLKNSPNFAEFTQKIRDLFLDDILLPDESAPGQ